MLTPVRSDVDSSSRRVVRYSTMHEAVQDSVLHVAERDGSSSVHERIDCADPVQPRFRRVEHAFGCLGRHHGVERREEERKSPDTVREETAEPAPGTVIAQAGQPDVEKDPSEPREETRRVVLVTMEPEKDTEVIVKPPEQEPEKSTEATVQPTESVEKEKGLEMEKRESEVSKDLPEPEIPEKPFVETEKAQEATPEQEVTFRMKAWSNWLHRQDQKDEEKRIRNRARQRALRQQRRSDRAAGLQQAVRKGPSVRRSWTVAKEDPEPKGSIRKVLKQHTKAPRKERTVKLRLVEREVDSSLPSYRKGRVHGAEQASCVDRTKGTSATESVRVTCEKGVRRDPAPKGSHDGELDRFGSLGCWGHGRDPRSSSGECSDPKRRSKKPHVIRLNGPRADHIRNHRSDRRHAGGRSGSEKTGDQAWDRLLHEATTSREGEGEVHVPGQVTVEASWQRRSERDRCQYFRMDVGDSRSASPRADRGEPEEVGRIGQKKENSVYHANKGKVQTSGTPTTTGSWQDPVGDRPEETASPAGTKPKEPASPVSVDPEKMLAVIAQTEIPIPGPKTPPTPTTRPKAKSRPLTEEQKAVADEVLAQKARDLLKAAERGTGTLREEKASTASGSGAKRVPKYLAHLTDEEREQLFRSELASERQAGAIEWEKELARQAKEEEERRKAKALYRSETSL